MAETVLGERLFTDGVVRRVFLDVEGRQFVVDDDDPVYGVWLDPATVEPDCAVTISGSGKATGIEG